MNLFCFGHNFLTGGIFSNPLCRLSTFYQFFAETPILTIFMATSSHTRIAILAVLKLVDMAMNMVNMGVSAKNRQNVDSLQKLIGKKVWPKQIIL